MISVPVKEAPAEELSIVAEASAAKKSAVDAEEGESTETAFAEDVRNVVCLIFYLLTTTTDDYISFSSFLLQ